VINELFKDLQQNINGTSNMHGQTVVKSGNTINIPGSPDQYIYLDSTNTSGFHVTITDWAGEIVVKVTGRYGIVNPTSRTITMDYTRESKTTSTFDYAVASRGMVTISKGTITSVDPNNTQIATVMSASTTSGAINMSGGTVGGDLNVVDGATASVTGGSVGQTSNTALIYRDHVHTVDNPEFPVVDTTVYKQYATNTYAAGASTQSNIRIPAGTNPKFSGGDTVRGIMYIESPNTVTFRGNFNLQGFIVVENAGSESVNTLDFRGNVSQFPLPSGTQFDPLRSTTGVAILAPTTLVTMSGSADSYLKGNLIVGKFNYAGSADVQIDQGTLMTLSDGALSANFAGKTVKFTATGANNTPNQGLSYSTYYAPKPSSYQEIMP
jgi:hypothetical protein